VRPGIKSSLDYLTALLKKKQKEAAKMKKIRLVSTQSTISSTSSSSITPSSGNTDVTSFVSKKNELEHSELIKKCIEEWCIQNKDGLNIPDFNFIYDIDYHLTFSPSLDKAEIKCSCGLSSALFLGDSGNIKVKLFFRPFLICGMFSFDS
jgi:hypothetical protein